MKGCLLYALEMNRFPNCKTPSGKEYETHPCTAVPVGGKSITIACQEEKVREDPGREQLQCGIPGVEYG